MESLRAFLPGALRVNANSFQTNLCRTNPPGADWYLPLGVRGRKAPHESSAMDGFELTIHGTGYPLPAGMTGLRVI
ncbi:MAG: hypothetical protein PHY16_03180 [Methylobacter sp.]|nr:hypothetical protein [Methylobacter sp.]